MRSPEKEIIHILITQVYNQGLISKTTCQNSEDLLDSVIDIPQFLWYPVCLTKEGKSPWIYGRFALKCVWGHSIFNMPLRVTFYARVSTDKFVEQGKQFGKSNSILHRTNQ